MKSLSHVRLFATQWTVAYQAPPSMGFSRQVGCHFLLQGIFPSRDRTPVSCIAGRRFNLWATREALKNYTVVTPKPQRLKEKMFTFNSYHMSTADWQGLFFPESLKNPGWRKADWLVTSPSGMCWQHSMVPTAEQRQLMSQTPVFLFFCLKLTHHLLPTVSWLPRVTRPP